MKGKLEKEAPNQLEICSTETVVRHEVVSKLRKLGPRDIGYLQDWTPANYQISDDCTEDFLKERLSKTPRKHSDNLQIKTRRRFKVGKN